MDSIKLTKRLIVQEDINFDTEGTGEVVDIVHADGRVEHGHKVNASHLPLSSDTRNEVGVDNIDDAVKTISQRVDGISMASVLTEDLLVEFQRFHEQSRKLHGAALTQCFRSGSVQTATAGEPSLLGKV